MTIIQELVERIDALERRFDRLSDIEIVPFNVGCRVYNSANISISHNTSTNLTFDSELFDTDGMHSTSTNTDRITFNTAGKYLVAGHVRWTTASGGRRQIRIYLNNTTYIGIVESGTTNDAGSVPIQLVSAVHTMAVNDYVTLQVLQTSGSSLNVETVSRYSPDFSAWRLA